MKNNQTLCQFLNIKVERGNPFIITHNKREVYREYYDGRWWKSEYDSEGREIYCEDSVGDWYKKEYNDKGNQIHYENSDGSWWKREYDTNGDATYYENSRGEWRKYGYDTEGNVIYHEDSSGHILDNRPKELTLDEIAEKFGFPVEQLKIKKD